MKPYLKMNTNKSTGITTIVKISDGTVQTFSSLSAALLQMNVYRDTLCPKTHKRVASEPFPVRSLVPNV